jgi:two-component system response regulator FixJ
MADGFGTSREKAVGQSFVSPFPAYENAKTAMIGERIVHVVDDDTDFRQSLARLLEAAGFAVASYASGSALLQVAPSLAAGCILLDIQMPRMNGLEVQEHLNNLGIRLPVIVMTGHGDVRTAVRAMKAGAIDFIEKPFDDAPLLATIENALTHPWQQRHALEVEQAVGLVAALSPRECQVLISLLAGNPNKVIAHDLAISVRTVEVHRARMLERLGVRTLAEAVRLGVLAGLR